MQFVRKIYFISINLRTKTFAIDADWGIKHYHCLNTLILVCLSLYFSGCRKDNLTDDPYIDIPSYGTSTDFILDSIFMYTKEVFLWNKSIPTYREFNPRGYTSPAPDNFQRALFDLVQFPINPVTGRPYEAPIRLDGSSKYSHLVVRYPNDSSISYKSNEGVGYNFGFDLFCTSEYDCRIVFVNQGSPAANARLKRGDRLLKVNNIAVSKNNMPLVELILQSSIVWVAGISADDEIFEAQLEMQFYESSGIFTNKVIKHNSKTTAYLALGEFMNTHYARVELERVFHDFAEKRVETIIVDLRYNRGGYLSAAEHLFNLIIPSIYNGKIMYSEHYNEMLQQRKATILRNQPYIDPNGKPRYVGTRRATFFDIDFSLVGNTRKINKAGNLEGIKKVYFIVGPNTASASELVINCLKPYLSVVLIGQTTYGKPVGSFAINIDNHQLYLTSFQIKNALNDGEYFEGINPDYYVNDDLRYDFGDERERSLNHAIKMIEGYSAPDNASVSIDYQKKAESRLIKDSFIFIDENAIVR